MNKTSGKMKKKMGLFAKSVRQGLEGVTPFTEYRVLFLGMENAGKTAILYRLKTGELVSTTPTVGFNVETYEIKDKSLTIWDLGGQLRSMWASYYPGVEGIIYVMDASNHEKLRENISMLNDVISALPNVNIPVLVFANKQDEEGALSELDVKRALDLPKDRHAYVQACSAWSGTGWLEGIQMFADCLPDKGNPLSVHDWRDF